MIKEAWRSRIRWLTIGCLLVCLSPWVGCGDSRQVKEDLPERDREFDRLSRLARSAFDNGQIDSAIQGYQKALDQAYKADDLDAVVDTHYNLGVCRLRSEDFAAALENVEAAQKESLAAGRPVPTDLLLLKATALYYGGEAEQVWQIGEDILSIRPPPSPEILSRVHFLRGRVAADRGDAAQLRTAIAALGEPPLAGFEADRFELLGRLNLLEGRWEDAVAGLDRAARLRADERSYRLMADTLAVSAKACAQSGRPEDAAYRYLRAARSAALSGDAGKAAGWLQETERLARQAGAESILDEACRLQTALKKGLQPQ